MPPRGYFSHPINPFRRSRGYFRSHDEPCLEFLS
jgi:hypothetical protein